jgi:U3 small nucleolar RNA-associated protein 7
MLSRTQKLKEQAREDVEATQLLYQQDEPGILEPENQREKTAFLSQKKLAPKVSLQAQNKMFSLEMEGGPHILDYTRNGRFMLVGGEGGRFASFDWQAGRLACEVDLGATGEKERIQDVCYLQNETMLAVAQANYVYVYDGRGVELHRLKKHARVRAIDYLPYHFLLASMSEDAFIRWQDVSCGKLASEWRFAEGLGQGLAMVQNPFNAVIHCGHANGVVSLWSPALNKPLVRISCHRGPVRSLAISQTGNAMATAGLDGIIKIWDLRHEYRTIREYRSIKPAISLSFSQRDLLAAAFGAHAVVWKDSLLSGTCEYPYMRHVVEGESIKQVNFCPYEDILGIGHSGGISSVLIPGAGEPNYDVYEANPFAGRRQRQEREIHSLLDKLPIETITLDGGQSIGRVSRNPQESIAADRAIQNAANGKVPDEKKRARGRSSALKRYLRKRANVIDKYKAEAAEKAQKETVHRDLGFDQTDSNGLSALNRFVSKSI